jgi:hypothetical protein
MQKIIRRLIEFALALKDGTSAVVGFLLVWVLRLPARSKR